MNFIVSWKVPNGIRRVVLNNWNLLDHLVTGLNVNNFSIEVFEYNSSYTDFTKTKLYGDWTIENDHTII